MNVAAARQVLFLNYPQVQTGSLGEHVLTRDYQLACQFLRCSIIDRTGQLPPLFAHRVLDPIPTFSPTHTTFACLCAARARTLVELAASEKRDLCVLWSGGIDSTAALIAIGDAARQSDNLHRIVVVLSIDSVQEHPRFFLQQIVDRYRVRQVTFPLADAFDTGAINVTGEHGDQLFGSHLLASYVRRGLANRPYEDILPLVVFERLGLKRGAQKIRNYLAPVIDAAPIPIHSLFDYFWWLNFALKWQEVSLRLPAWGGARAGAIETSLHHFYRTPEFQNWAMGEAKQDRPAVWADYKRPAREYILAATGDKAYFATKEKEDSLRNVLRPVDQTRRNCVVMYDDFLPEYRELSA